MAMRQAQMVGQLSGSLDRPRRQQGSVAARLVLHGCFLLIAVACFATYGHFKLEGRSTAAIVSLVLAAIFAFAPIRDVLRVVFRIEGKALHVAHGLGSLGLISLPLTGVVSGSQALTRTWMAPFAIMGAAQAVMHQDHPRNAKQAAALQRFATSLPEVAQFAGSKDIASPTNARRAVGVISDILAKAQALGETELESDPGFQGALRQTSTRVGASFGLDAVDLVLRSLASNPATASQVPALQRRLAMARNTIAGTGSR